ncbi:MAG: rhodanese-like domain-containing protein [bacterium]
MKKSDILTEKRLRHLEEFVAEITIADLKRKINNGEKFILIDVSHREDFNKSHLEGAVNLNLGVISESAEIQFHKYQQIIVTCQNADSIAGKRAVQLLQRAGFTNALLLKGGKQDWQNAGLPILEFTEDTNSSDE